MPEQEVEMSPLGELNFKIPQLEWVGNDGAQESQFAGQQMILNQSEDNTGTYELHYLGLMVSGFENIDNAKFNAADFARSVFQILGEFIKDS